MFTYLSPSSFVLFNFVALPVHRGHIRLIRDGEGGVEGRGGGEGCRSVPMGSSSL